MSGQSYFFATADVTCTAVAVIVLPQISEATTKGFPFKNRGIDSDQAVGCKPLFCSHIFLHFQLLFEQFFVGLEICKLLLNLFFLYKFHLIDH